MTDEPLDWTLHELGDLIEQRLDHGRYAETQQRWDEIAADLRARGFPVGE